MKYREFLTHCEATYLDEIVRMQKYHRDYLKNLRKAYVKLLWLGRDRARKGEKV